MAKRNDTQSAQIEENVKSAFYHQFIDQRVNRLTDPIVPTAANSESCLATPVVVLASPRGRSPLPR